MASRNSAPPSPASPYASHIPALDGIRGIAVLGVMASHFFPGTASSSLTAVLRSVLSFGATGVDLFFVLSGFLITGILYDSLGERHYLRKFYGRRALRIFPLYYAVLLPFIIGAIFFGRNYHGELLSFALFLQNSGVIAPTNYAQGWPGNLPIGHLWSLAIEEQFYLVWSLVVLAVHRRSRLLLVCTGLLVGCPVLRFVLLLHGWTFAPVHNNTLLRADTLLSGAALALLLRTGHRDWALRAGPWLATAAALLLVLLTMAAPTMVARYPWGVPAFLSVRYSLLSQMYVGLIAASLRPGAVASLFSLPALRFFGKYSYGLYVLHLILFSYLEQPMRQFVRDHLSQNKGVGVALTGTASLLLSVCAAVLSYNLYEKPFLQFKRYFSYNHRPKPERHHTATGE